MAKALVLFSGGLDSILAARVLMEQGIEVTAIAFKSLFFDTEKAKKGAEMLGINLIEVDFSAEHLEMVKNPPNGYGKNMNPCIDCHAMMFRWAGEWLGEVRDVKYDFLATGEVLGQRPMSQNRQALDRVALYSGFGARLLRPLSARLLSETVPEKEGLVDRDRLLDISGRGRDRQLELASSFGIVEFPTAGGGCLLTDIEFSKKLKEMLLRVPSCTIDDVSLLRCGRVFWFGGVDGCALGVIGRNKDENEGLARLAKRGDLTLGLVGEIGPLALVRSFGLIFDKKNEDIHLVSPISLQDIDLEKKDESGIIKTVAGLVCYYATKTRGRMVQVNIKKV